MLNRVAPELEAARPLIGVSEPLANQWDQFVDAGAAVAGDAQSVDDEDDDDRVSLRVTAAVELGAKRQNHVPRKRPARATEDEFDATGQTTLSVPAKSRARLDDDRPVPVPAVSVGAWPTLGSSAANRSSRVDAPVSFATVSAWPTASAASAAKTTLVPPVPPREAAVARVAVASEEVCDWNAFVEEPGVEDDDDDDSDRE
jgi:hypothetical protein